MKSSIVLIMMLLVNMTAICQSPVDSKSTIRKVIIYPQGAQLEHECQVLVPEGQSQVRLTGLSPFMRPETIRVDGDGSFTILNVQHRYDYLNDAVNNNEIKTIKEKIESLQRKVEDEEARVRIAKEKVEYFQANRNISGKDKSPDVESFKAFYGVYSGNMESLELEILKKQREIGDIQKEITRLNNQLNSLTSKATLPSASIWVLIDSKQAKKVNLFFNYLVDNASWTPSYDVRFAGQNKPLIISYKANIKQSTGIDWKDVKLVLSTAKTNISAQIPEFNPWYIGFSPRQKNQPMLLQEVQAPDFKAPAVSGGIFAKEDESASVPEITVDKRLTSAEYTIELPQTIPSSEENNIVKYREAKTDALFEYEALPKQSPNVYLIGRIPQWYNAELLDGDLNVYLENSYIGKSTINTLNFGDTLSLSFGIDNNISIQRKKMSDFTGNQFIGQNKKETKGYRITCRNNKSDPVSVKITDQLPVSLHEDITVESLELSGGMEEKETGKVTWTLNLNSGESKELIFKYSVKYPKDKRVYTE